MDDRMTPGQAQYVEATLERAQGGEETTVAVTGVRTSYEIIETPEDTQRPWRVRWTIEGENGSMATVDEWPPLSAEEEEERVATEQAAAEAYEAARIESEAAARKAEVDDAVKAALIEAGVIEADPEDATPEVDSET